MSMNPFTLEAFKEWVDKQPADKYYIFPDASRCAVGQYAATMGMRFHELPGGHDDPFRRPIEGSFLNEANRLASFSPWYFGDLSKRIGQELEKTRERELVPA